MNKSYDAFMDDLTQKWLSYFNHNDTYWTTLEKTV